MFIKNNAAKKPEKRLLQILDRLNEAQITSLIDYAEFLASRTTDAQTADASGAAEPVAPRPLNIPRPEKESVVKAIKRLAITYPMVDRSKMLNETSALMTQHIMQGRDAAEVIDELEALFRACYEKLYLKEEEKEPEK